MNTNNPDLIKVVERTVQVVERTTRRAREELEAATEFHQFSGALFGAIERTARAGMCKETLVSMDPAAAAQEVRLLALCGEYIADRAADHAATSADAVEAEGDA